MSEATFIANFVEAALKVTRSPLVKEIAAAFETAEELRAVGLLSEGQLLWFEDKCLEAINKISEANEALTQLARVVNGKSEDSEEWSETL